MIIYYLWASDAERNIIFLSEVTRDTFKGESRNKNFYTVALKVHGMC